MTVAQTMAMRQSVLNARHLELGSKLDGDTWNNMSLPWSYDTPLIDEVVATRHRATLIDVSSVNLVNVSGSDAEAVLDRLVTIDVTKLKPGTMRIACEVGENGGIIDDILVIRHSSDHFYLSHGSGATKNGLASLSEGRNVKWEPDNDTHCMSLQGPLSCFVLDPHCDAELSKLGYFEFVPTRLFGKDVVISRSGYSGEYGLEVYCGSHDAVYLWDTILAVGKPAGVMPCSWNCLEVTRIEACLLFFPFEMPEGDTTPWEINMGWAVDVDKAGDYIGKAAVLAAKGHERVKQGGIVCDSTRAVEAGAGLFMDGKEVGVVTSAYFSEYLMQSLAMVHLKPEAQAIGTALEVRGRTGNCKARVARTPFYDPMRLRTYPERRR